MGSIQTFLDAFNLLKNKLSGKYLACNIAKKDISVRFFSGFSLIAAISTLTLLSFSATANAVSLYNEDTQEDLSDNGLNPTALGNLTLGTNSLKAKFNGGETNPSLDYFTFTVPEELVLIEIVLQSWEAEPNFEDLAFFAVQEGKVFDYVFPNDLENPAEGLLGWSHLRSTQVGDSRKVLTEMSLANLNPEVSGLKEVYKEEANSNPYSPEQIAQLPEGVTEEDLINNLTNLADTWTSGAKGFSLPLESGEYSFWLRQGSDTSITVELNFNTALTSTQTSISEPFSVVGIFTVFGLGIMLPRKR